MLDGVLVAVKLMGSLCYTSCSQDFANVLVFCQMNPQGRPEVV